MWLGGLLATLDGCTIPGAPGSRFDASADVAPLVDLVDVAPLVDLVDVAPLVDLVDVAPSADLVDVAPSADLVDVVVSTDVPTLPSDQRSCHPEVAGCGLVEIVGGTFTAGAASECTSGVTLTCAHGASPPQTGLTVGNFALDAHEVTVARFRAFWTDRRDGGAAIRARGPIAYPDGTTIAWSTEGQPPVDSGGFFNWTSTASDRDAHPINGVDWWIAQEFCVWDGGRLPTETEWEYAARGRAVPSLVPPLVPGRLYPWGDNEPTTTCDRAAWNRCPGENGANTRHVDRFAASGGLYDLAGNVWEWTADTWDVYPSCRRSTTNPFCYDGTDRRVVHGGAAGVTDTASLRSASRATAMPTERQNFVGFRCARTR